MYFLKEMFATTTGGYPNAINFSTTAIEADGSQFYIDLGKSAAYGSLQAELDSNINEPFNAATYGYIITGIEIGVADAGTNSFVATSFSTRIYNAGEGAWSDAIESLVPAASNPSSTDILVGGPTELWGKSWTFAMINSDFRVNLFDPVEPAGGIALMADYIYLNVWYKITNDISFSSGKISITSGNITI